jgi:hypothetical protein
VRIEGLLYLLSDLIGNGLLSLQVVFPLKVPEDVPWCVIIPADKPVKAQVEAGGLCQRSCERTRDVDL